MCNHTRATARLCPLYTIMSHCNTQQPELSCCTGGDFHKFSSVTEGSVEGMKGSGFFRMYETSLHTESTRLKTKGHTRVHVTAAQVSIVQVQYLPPFTRLRRHPSILRFVDGVLKPLVFQPQPAQFHLSIRHCRLKRRGRGAEHLFRRRSYAMRWCRENLRRWSTQQPHCWIVQ